MTEVTVIETPPSPLPVETVELPASLETPAETVEAVTDTAVAIAEIEADRDVTIAETHAAVEIARVEAEAERREGWELEEWQTNLQAQVTSLSETVSEMALTIAALSTPPALPVVVATETDLTPPSTSPETVETPMEVIAESEAESREEAPAAPVRRRHRAI